MARMGIFNRNDSTPESVPRSVQMLNRRHTFDTKYMQIVPNFVQYMYPNESISIKTTNLVKSIPLKTPQLSNVRIVQRFVAVPLRLLWFAWEDYIKGENDSAFTYEEPYILNVAPKRTLTDAQFLETINLPVGFKSVNSSGTKLAFIPRKFVGNVSGYVPSNAANDLIIPYTNDSAAAGYTQFRPHELGDYLRAPLYVPFGKMSTKLINAGCTTQVFSAFPFAAYQLAYSYMYRAPNVQTRVDDYYEMQHSYEDNGEHEYTCGVAETKRLTSAPWHEMINLDSECLATGMENFNSDKAISDDSTAVWLTSWDKVEHFPLKNGANWSMLACRPNATTGLPEYRPSQICLFRKRFANYQSDNFTCCNPWQQRGEEVQIPVNGTVEISSDSVSFQVTPTGTVTSTFTGSSSNVVVDNLKYAGADGDINTHLYISSTNSGVSPVIMYPIGSADNPPSPSGVNQASLTGSVTPEGTVSSTFTGSVSQGTVSAEFSSSSSLYVSPSSLKFALALQHVKELQAQIDNRYQSYIKKFFGAYAQDYRLDRPEFIGGMVQDLNISQVTQSSESTDSSPQGTMTGLASSVKTSGTVKYHAKEHCIILGLMHIIPDTEYIGGLDREFNTQDRFDWMLPNFAHVAEQPVKHSELALTNLGIDNRVRWNPIDKTAGVSMNGAFGYEPVYNYLRWSPNYCTGAFRDTLNSLGSYEYYKPWIITRDFGFSIGDQYDVKFKVNSPTLSDRFLSGRYGCDYSNFVVTDPEVMYPFMCDSYFKVRMVRTIPSRGLPSKV